MPDIQYARNDDRHVAYQVVGDGPLDVVLVADWFGNVELMWDGAAFADALNRLAAFCRLLVFDKSGIGLSDPVSLDGLPTLEDWIDDVRVVMDDADSKSAALIGVGAGGPMVMQFAAMHPHRASAVVLINSYARLSRADDYLHGIPDHLRDQILEDSYLDGSSIDFLTGGDADAAFRAWWARYQRQSVSPRTAEVMRRMMFEVDVRSVLTMVQAPTLVLHRRDDPWIRVAHGRYLADHIPDARLEEVPGAEDLFFLGDTDVLFDEVEAFVTGARPPLRTDRTLATLLFTDLVDSTATAAELGDLQWTKLLDQHDRVVRDCLEHFRGRVVTPTGDGVVATFDGPGRAINCAIAIRDELSMIGLRVRSGIHTGEIVVREREIAGIAVHLGARIGALAESGEVLVSSTVRELVAGSGISFHDRGQRALKGIPDEWHVYAVVT
ncbi:MAG: hypothetical protein QOJ67_2675 [Acidimicrobiaceae bacterium]